MAKRIKLTGGENSNEKTSGVKADAPGETIVGGQPERGLHQFVEIPVGIERALYLAAKNPAFRKKLLEDRSGAIERAGLRLTSVETMVLESLPQGTMASIIDRLAVQDRTRRGFMKKVAASMVTLAAGSATSGCSDDWTEDEGDGSVNETRRDRVIHDIGEHFSADGIMPDVPWYEEDADTDGAGDGAGDDGGDDAGAEDEEGGLQDGGLGVNQDAGFDEEWDGGGDQGDDEYMDFFDG